MSDIGFQIFAAAICLVGGGINLFFPEAAIAASKGFTSIGGFDKAVPEFFFSKAVTRATGLVGFVVGLVIAIRTVIEIVR